MNTAKLSTEAKKALINVGSNRQGATVDAAPEVLTELYEAGLTGSGDGLTTKGSIVRERVMTEALDAFFN